MIDKGVIREMRRKFYKEEVQPLMNKITLKAIKGSIQKWQKIIDGIEVDSGTSNCPLCDLFLVTINKKSNCRDCPVVKETGSQLCQESPYGDWAGHHENYHHLDFKRNDYRIECGECRHLAQAELRFLKSLLPRGSAR